MEMFPARSGREILICENRTGLCYCVHALSRACTSNVAKIAFQQSEALSALCARFSPFNSGFSRKAREKHLACQVGLYCNLRSLRFSALGVHKIILDYPKNNIVSQGRLTRFESHNKISIGNKTITNIYPEFFQCAL